MSLTPSTHVDLFQETCGKIDLNVFDRPDRIDLATVLAGVNSPQDADQMAR
jgi:hypothetical protein